MNISIALLFFIFGTIMGSFYNVVGYRIPKGKSILYPPSHCPRCNHKLGSLELIPILSYIFLRGKCKKCHDKISCFYPIFEFLTGLLFAISYLVFGLSYDCLIAIIFISMLLIIFISDYQTMIIPDSVLIVFSSLIIVVKFFSSSIEELGISIVNGFLAFILMLGLKFLGDFLFNKESMGGGDIKLLGIFGLTLGFPLSVISIFLSAVIGLPISLILIRKKESHEIPFGPFLAISATILLLLNMSFDKIVTIFII